MQSARTRSSEFSNRSTSTQQKTSISFISPKMEADQMSFIKPAGEYREVILPLDRSCPTHIISFTNNILSSSRHASLHPHPPLPPLPPNRLLRPHPPTRACLRTHPPHHDFQSTATQHHQHRRQHQHHPRRGPPHKSSSNGRHPHRLLHQVPTPLPRTQLLRRHRLHPDLPHGPIL